MNISDEIKKAQNILEQQRDELRVKMHLAKAEAKEEWEEMEKKWDHFKGKAEGIQKELGEVATGVDAGLNLILDEIKEGYHRIRKVL